MQLVTVRLDRIFDVVHQVHKGQALTMFGFQYGPERVFGISVQGRHVLAQGAVLTACLRVDSDWTTLVGSYNHATGETVIESAAQEIIGLVAFGIVTVVALRTANILRLSELLLLTGIWIVASLRSLRFLRRVRAALARLRAEPVPPLRFPAVDQRNGNADA